MTFTWSGLIVFSPAGPNKKMAFSCGDVNEAGHGGREGRDFLPVVSMGCFLGSLETPRPLKTYLRKYLNNDKVSWPRMTNVTLSCSILPLPASSCQSIIQIRSVLESPPLLLYLFSVDFELHQGEVNVELEFTFKMRMQSSTKYRSWQLRILGRK